jgi:mannobiose 2-epimerase
MGQDFPTIAKDYLPRLEKNLKQNIVPFWMSKSLDKKNGGYLINFDQQGKPLEKPDMKMIVTQARQVWLFSRLARAGYGSQEYLDAAELGYRFLKDKMWDSKNGGFYWSVDSTGNNILQRSKITYGESFALYALSEYCLASKKPEVLEFTHQFFEVLDAKAHDNQFGGYLESFNEDWTPWKPQPSAARINPAVYGFPENFKSMNTHLHMMESVANYYRAFHSDKARERLLELIQIQSNAVVRKTVGGCTDIYKRNWEPDLSGRGSIVSYGHDLENIWLLIDSCDAAAINPHPFIDLFKTLFDYSMKYGFDEKLGGVFSTGKFNQPASDRSKIWWVEAEAMTSALYMYRFTGDPQYLTAFQKTYDFIDKYQTDWTNGEWFENIKEDGKPTGTKGHAWKAGYHNGRAMIECIAILKQAGK